MIHELSSYFEGPEFKEILAKYEGMVENHTHTYFDAEELTDIAEYYTSRNEEKKAEEAINLALKLHPSNTDVLIFKSRSLAIKGKIEEAYQIVNLIEDKSDREVKFLKADLLMDENKLDEAEAVFLELAEAEGESLEILMDITLAYMDANRKEYAAKWLKKINQKGINETNSQSYRDLWCDFCMTFGDAEKAIKSYMLTLDEQPYSIKHWNGLAKSHLALDNIAQAHEAVDFALAIDENDKEALEVKAFCYMLSENYLEAIKIYQKIIPIIQNKNRIYALLIKCYMDLDLREEALNTCLDWLQKCPNLTEYEKTEIYIYTSMCLANLDRAQEGMKYIDAALSLDPIYQSAIIQKAMLHLQLKETEQAEVLFRKATSLAVEDELIEVLYNITNCYFHHKEYSKTIEWCNKIITEYPNEQLEALLLVATCYMELGDFNQCVSYFEQAMKISNQHLNPDLLTDKRLVTLFSKIQDIINNNSKEE